MANVYNLLRREYLEMGGDRIVAAANHEDYYLIEFSRDILYKSPRYIKSHKFAQLKALDLYYLHEFYGWLQLKEWSKALKCHNDKLGEVSRRIFPDIIRRMFLDIGYLEWRRSLGLTDTPQENEDLREKLGLNK